MKKTIFTALMLSLFTFVNAQDADTNETTDYSKWQATI